MDDICSTSRELTHKVESFFDKLGLNNEYNFVGNPGARDYNLMGPMVPYLNFSAANDELKINVSYIYETIGNVNH